MREAKESNLISTIDQYAEQVCADFDVPGLAVAIVKDDAIILAKGYGVKRMGGDQPISENTLFGIASISKSFTAMAVAMLVDEGKLTWDDPVTKHLPLFQMHDPYAAREITVLDLLVHRTGLNTVSGGTVWYGSEYNRNDIIHRIRHLKPVSSFRSTYAYQNNMYLVAGQLIPALTGKSWDAFITERIFAPLAMHSSNTSISAFDSTSDVSQPHTVIDGVLQVIRAHNYDNVGPAASINTTVLELAAYARLLLKGGRYKEQQLYSAEIARDLWTPHMLIPLLEEYPAAYRHLMPKFHHTYALGWNIQDYHGQGQRRVSHSGGIDGLCSLLTMIPEQNLGIIVFINNESSASWVLTNLILDFYQGVTEMAWYDVAQKEWLLKFDKQFESIDGRIPNTTPSLNIEQYAGRYYSKLYGDIEVRMGDGRLWLHFLKTAVFTAKLTHWHYNTFQIKWQEPIITDGLLTFILDAQGNISEIQLEQPNLLDVDFSELHPIKRVIEPTI